MLSGHLAVDTFQKCGNPKREWKIALGGGGILNLFRLLKIRFSRKSNAITGKRFTKHLENFLIKINSGFNPGK